MAAAVADFRPADVRSGKIKKDSLRSKGEERLVLALERTDDILAGLAARKRPDQLVVGFAAEKGDGALEYAREKLTGKALDAVVVNDIGRLDIGFDAPDNEVTIITREREQHVPKASKEAVAAAILDQVR
jgi:phosphopantothenoylcysteine decarboxylase/phosphopantothenate--cysteine ligase